VTETPNETPNGDYLCITRYSLLGRPPLCLPSAGAPGDLAVGSTPDALFAQDLMTPKDSTEWHNRVPARSLLSFSWRRPVRRAAAIRCPILPAGLTHGRIPPCSARHRYPVLRPIPTCRHASTVPAPDARSCQYSASRSTTRLRLLRAITTPFVTEDAATTIRILARTHVPSRGQTPDGCDGQVDLCDGLMSWSGGCLRRRCREGFRWVVVLVGGQAMVQLAEQAAEQIAQPRGVAIAGDTALVVAASGLQ
jgi:hypothetical protein